MNKHAPLIAILLTASALLAFSSDASWEYPEYDPSYGNQIAPPVNSGPTPQTKHGSLTLNGGVFTIDSNIASSNSAWNPDPTASDSLTTDGALSVYGIISTSQISAQGYLSKSLISKLTTTPAERPLCVNKSDGRIMPCTPDSTTPPTKSLPLPQ